MTGTHAERTAPVAAPVDADVPPATGPGSGSGGAAGPGADQARRRGRVVIAAVVVLAVGGAGATAVVLTRGTDKGATNTGPRLSTAPVVRTDLSDEVQVDGTLGFGGTYTFIGAAGTLTWLPQPGQEIVRGERVFAVDGHDVPLFYGTTPMWRTLEEGVHDGRDVRQLQANLSALHHGGLTVDGHFGPATREAVEDWQHDLGRDRTGAVQQGDVAIAPGRLRIQSVAGVLGGPAHLQVLQATGTQRIVTVPLPVDRQGIARTGGKVRLELPGGVQTTGHISDVGAVAAGTGTGSGATAGAVGAATANATIPVHVRLDDSRAAGRLAGAPATVYFTGQVRRGVLAVPVSALLAQGPHDYAVVVADSAGRRRTVPVTLGMFGSGQVAVTGPGLAPGMRVEVPAS
ncbi:MAG: peptidoglycan-binding protein [Streptosporangiaceae bacterium]|nr:peptidoglycan-binding protein [Streptosporangiaceae bacterium]